MSKKCNIKNGEIGLCEELYHVVNNLDTKIQKVNMARMGELGRDYIGAITFRYGRKKNDLVALSFCPICGGAIR